MEQVAIDYEALKKQCIDNGLIATDLVTFSERLTPEHLKEKKKQYKKVISIVRYFLDKFLLSIPNVPMIVSVCDADGYLLTVQGDEQNRQQAKSMGIEEGVRFKEEDCGINVITLALKYSRKMEIIGEQHFHQFLHQTVCYAIPIMDREHDRVIGAIGIMTDIKNANPLMLPLLLNVNESIEREISLIKQNHQLNMMNTMMMKTTQNGILMVDKDGFLIDFNPYAERITEWNKVDLIGKSVDEVPYFGECLRESLNNRTLIKEKEISFLREDGNELTFLLDCNPIIQEDGYLIGAFVEFRDYTVRKETELLLLNSEKLSAVGQMAASVAHEIRNPLTTIRGFIQFLGQDIRDQSHLRLILSELDRINFIVGEFLILSKPHVLSYQDKNLHSILNEILSLFQVSANMNNILIKRDFIPEDVVIYCDENQLKQVFVNILKNGVEALPYGGKIIVKTRMVNSNEITIFIEDNGIGMDQEQIRKLGSPFYSTKNTGTGLGYLVIKNIIDHHNGRLVIDSEKGKGTSIQIILGTK